MGKMTRFLRALSFWRKKREKQENDEKKKKTGSTESIGPPIFQSPDLLVKLLGCSLWWDQDLMNSGISGYKSNEELDCIFNRHWFPESDDEPTSMSQPLIKHQTSFLTNRWRLSRSSSLLGKHGWLLNSSWVTQFHSVVMLKQGSESSER